MADYYPLIRRAVAGLDKNTEEARRSIYERARAALVDRLRDVEPPLAESDIAREQEALEEAIDRVEQCATETGGPTASPSAAMDDARQQELKGFAGKTQETPAKRTGPPKVFISYRRDDSRYQAREIFRALTRALPREHVFMDVDTIQPGENFVKKLEQWVEQCDNPPAQAVITVI